MTLEIMERELNSYSRTFYLNKVGTIIRSIGENGPTLETNAADWAGTDPANMEEAINRLAAAFESLLVQLDTDNGLTLQGTYLTNNLP